MMLHVVEALDSSEAALSRTRTATSARSFKPLGEVRDQLLLVRTTDFDALYLAWCYTQGRL